VRLFGSGGLLRRLGTTVIYTTHDGKRLFELRMGSLSDSDLEQFKGSADRVFQVDMKGALTELPHQRSNMVDLMEIEQAPASFTTKKETVQRETKKAAKAETNQSTKLLVQDGTVYRTYFKSVGTFHTATFLAFAVVFAFTLKFPGMMQLSSSLHGFTKAN
jgi:ATP-binding cassette, subfamily C (CFTR/MRP), member 1